MAMTNPTTSYEDLNLTPSTSIQEMQGNTSTQNPLFLHIPTNCPPLPLLEHLLIQPQELPLKYRSCASSLEGNSIGFEDDCLNLWRESENEDDEEVMEWLQEMLI